MEIFHYTELEDWSYIREDGLTPLNFFNEHTRAIWALLEPKPDSWTKNPLFPNVWEELKQKVGPLLIAVQIDRGDSEVFVADRGLYQLCEDGVATDEYQGRKIGRQEYFDSKIPILNYLDNNGEEDFLLPEVIVTKTVPANKIRLCERQPLIEDVLESLPDNGNSKLRHEFLYQLRYYIGLRSWYRNYIKGEPDLRMGFTKEVLLAFRDIIR